MIKYEQLKSLANPMDTNDCTVMATCILTGCSYDDGFTALELVGRKFRRGATIEQIRQALDILGFKSGEPIYPRKQGKAVKSFYTGKTIDYKYGQYTGKTIGRIHPEGVYLIDYSQHVGALVNGIVEDFTANTKHRINRLIPIIEA